MDRSDRAPRWGLVLGVAALLVLFLLRDVAAAIVGGILWAVLAWPLHQILRRRLGNGSAAAATLFMTGLALAAVFGAVVWLVADDLRGIAQSVGDGALERSEDDLPSWVTASALWPAVQNGFVNLAGALQARLAREAGRFVLQFPIALFVAFTCLREGHRLVLRIQRAVPLPAARTFEILDRATLSARGVARGQVLTAALKGAIGSVGFLIAGVPHAALWGLVMALFVFLPVLTAWMVWVPASLWLASTGHPIAAVFLATWGALVMGLSDNIARPILVGRQARLHPLVVLLGIAGGAATLGLVGLFAGPVLLGAAAAVFAGWSDERGSASRAPAPLPHPRPAPVVRNARPTPTQVWPTVTAFAPATSLVVPLTLSSAEPQ